MIDPNIIFEQVLLKIYDCVDPTEIDEKEKIVILNKIKNIVLQPDPRGQIFYRNVYDMIKTIYVNLGDGLFSSEELKTIKLYRKLNSL